MPAQATPATGGSIRVLHVRRTPSLCLSRQERPLSRDDHEQELADVSRISEHLLQISVVIPTHDPIIHKGGHPLGQPIFFKHKRVGAESSKVQVAAGGHHGAATVKALQTWYACSCAEICLMDGGDRTFSTV